MKELYISPELEILCFAPVENIATNTWGGWNAFSMTRTTGTGINPSVSDETFDSDYSEGVEGGEDLVG